MTDGIANQCMKTKHERDRGKTGGLIRGVLVSSQWVLMGLLIFDLGFNRSIEVRELMGLGYLLSMPLLLLLTLLRLWVLSKQDNKALLQISAILLTILLLLSFVSAFHFSGGWDFIGVRALSIPGLLLYFFLQLLPSVRKLYHAFYNPALLFIASFAIITVFGAILLKLPKATTTSISWVDAFFTASSAVSVTGLAVVDTGTIFTRFGQWVILILIQFGGLGVLTFTSFFSFFFKGGSSYREGLYVKDFLSSDNLSNVLKLAVKIVVFTLSIELLGMLGIWWFTSDVQRGTALGDQLFFSFFHAVSAFCNAGFSSLSAGLYDPAYRFLYGFHWIVASLLILGGLGFNIVFNFVEYVKVFSGKIGRWVQSGGHLVKPVRVITLNAYLVLVTTAVLLIGGTLLMYLFEKDNILAEHSSWWGKFTTAFFCAATPRTAGFNSFDMMALSTPTVLLMLLLMWIGASPASTGGGIKTSTFAISMLNILAVARGRHFLELKNREIADASVKRAFAIISISLLVIGLAVFLVSWFEPGKELMPIAFECFSAYSTVGLSLGLTTQLSDASKITIMLVMFVGRIGTLNLLIGLMRQLNGRHYQYPQENILIN